jgi:hypothetical protein
MILPDTKVTLRRQDLRVPLADADDDMVLELAFAAGCRHIVTHNVNDFHGSGQLGIIALSPGEFLSLIRKKS